MSANVRKLQTFLDESTAVDGSAAGETKRQRVVRALDADPAITFHDFRTDTVLKYPNLSFLGPASMGVYWLKTYLKSEQFGWVHHTSPARKDRRKKSYFCHIPGQYLRQSSMDAGGERPSQDSLIQRVLDRGTTGVHFAPSYIGIYNMIRKYGKFGISYAGDIVLLDYEGPPLPEDVQHEEQK